MEAKCGNNIEKEVFIMQYGKKKKLEQILEIENHISLL